MLGTRWIWTESENTGYGNNSENQGKMVGSGHSCRVCGNGHATGPTVGWPDKSPEKGSAFPAFSAFPTFPARKKAEVQPTAPTCQLCHSPLQHCPAVKMWRASLSWKTQVMLAGLCCTKCCDPPWPAELKLGWKRCENCLNCGVCAVQWLHVIRSGTKIQTSEQRKGTTFLLLLASLLIPPTHALLHSHLQI